MTKILIVDDEVRYLEVLQHFLESGEMNCATASSVAEACELLGRNSYDLMLLDWRLDRSGAEVLKVCRELYPLMPVVVMSGIPSDMLDVQADAFMAGADSFLQKGFSAPLLKAHIRRWLIRNAATPKAVLPQRAEDIVPLEDLKRVYIRHAANLLDNNLSLTAERLGIHRHTVAAALKDAV